MCDFALPLVDLELKEGLTEENTLIAEVSVSKTILIDHLNEPADLKLLQNLYYFLRVLFLPSQALRYSKYLLHRENFSND